MRGSIDTQHAGHKYFVLCPIYSLVLCKPQMLKRNNMRNMDILTAVINCFKIWHLIVAS